MEEVAHEWLRVDGKVLYVEPFMAESNARGDVFLAGRYNFLGELDTLNNWKPVGQDGDVVGAYLPHDSTPRIIRSPFPDRRLSGFRALPQGDSSWLVTFGEATIRQDSVGVTYTDSTRNLWLGRFDGHSWSKLERLPLPPTAVSTHSPSVLIQHADTLFWALLLAWGHGSIVYRRSAGIWTFTEVPGYPASVTLSPASGLTLVTVAPDTTLANDANSLLLWRREPSWKRASVAVPGIREEVYQPALGMYGSRHLITWQTPTLGGPAWAWQVHAMVSDTPSAEVPAFIVDSAGSGMSPYAPLRLTDGRPLWITDHRPSRGIGEIQFAIWDERVKSSVSVGRRAHDFVTPFIAASAGENEVLVVGGHYEPRRYIVSEIFRFHLRCQPEAAHAGAVAPF